MNCPNCTATFRLRADYATHLPACLPAPLDPAVTDALLARLNAAARRPSAASKSNVAGGPVLLDAA